nr:D171 [uncultured bacterium]
MRLLGFLTIFSLLFAWLPSTAQAACEDFQNQADAQDFLRGDSNDPDGLDPDNDGIACEDLPEPRDDTPVERTFPDGEDEGEAAPAPAAASAPPGFFRNYIGRSNPGNTFDAAAAGTNGGTTQVTRTTVTPPSAGDAGLK